MIMTHDEEKKILKDALRVFGIDAQFDILIEECAELIKAVCKYKRGTVGAYSDMFEEIADVRIMMDQVCLYFDEPSAELWRMKKLKRLEERIAKCEKAGDA